ncbi:hypothetical protein DFH07DRAFT_768317 [Mycena maculata]|uniref:Uncharacterized protein n=1 Tax=Mycena maculata TaxID=230809 RepID=A0AAD7NRA0_9AGAR|nr:hypothetical protein DFH07DRAFT_768317 [Mycena maculata]
MRLYLALTYYIDEWVTIVFKDLTKKSILDITENDEQLLGRSTYCLLVRTHAEVDQHRTGLTFRTPLSWEEAWFGKAGTPGMVAALLDQCIQGVALYKVLHQYQVPGMCDDTAEKISSIKREDVIIDDAVKKLKKSMVHALPTYIRNTYLVWGPQAAAASVRTPTQSTALPGCGQAAAPRVSQGQWDTYLNGHLPRTPPQRASSSISIMMSLDSSEGQKWRRKCLYRHRKKSKHWY